MVKRWAERGYTVLTVDEAHIVLGSVPKRGWFRGKKPVVQLGSVKGARRRASIIGAIGNNGVHHFDVFETANWDNFEKFLGNIRKKFGKVLIFMDNASYPGKAKLKEMSRETNYEMQFRFIPPYTPELNPIETQWSCIKGALSGFILADAADVKKKITVGIRKKAIPIINLHECYIA